MTDEDLESEANLFAMLLLMPTEFIKEDFDKGISIADDKQVKTLANKYQVPLTAMALRIAYYIQHKI